MTDVKGDAEPIDIGLALSLSSAALESSLEEWIAPVVDGQFDSVWSLENPLSDQAEPLVWLAAASTLAPDAGIGTAALIAPVRHPLLLARQLATLDRISRGRLLVGVAIGRRAQDYELSGSDFSRRGRTLDNTIETLRSIWSDEPLNVETSGWTLCSDTPVGARPTTASGPGLLVGGHADVALERAARLGDGYLAGATSGPAHASATKLRIAELLDRDGRDVPGFRFVANLFVHVGETRERAMAEAVEIFRARHGGPPPYDPLTVVAGGPAEHVAATVVELLDSGYQGVNLVPVAMSVDQVNAAATVASLVKQ